MARRPRPRRLTCLPSAEGLHIKEGLELLRGGAPFDGPVGVLAQPIVDRLLLYRLLCRDPALDGTGLRRSSPTL